jgi:hypothetical protein
MIRILILFITIIATIAIEKLFENKFLFDNEGWQITGNKKIEPAIHQSYNINKEISHYIMFKDNLINIDYKNENDNSLWYFESPEIIINNIQKIGTTESENFKPKYPTLLSFTITSFVGDFNNLNDNLYLVRIKNGINCLIFEADNYDGKTKLFNIPFNSKFWKWSNTLASVTDEEMKKMFIGPFTIEILGDWTRDYEVIGLDNVMII